jgi:hypothetical protein
LVVELFFAIAGGDWLCQELGASDCAFQRKGIFALEQMNAGICGHVTAKRRRGQADAECVVFRAVCGKRDGARVDAGALATTEDCNRGGERQGVAQIYRAAFGKSILVAT